MRDVRGPGPVDLAGAEHGQPLPAGVGGRDGLAPAVGGPPEPGEQAEDLLAVLDRPPQQLEREHAGALGEQHTGGLLVVGADLATGRQPPQLGHTPTEYLHERPPDHHNDRQRCQ